MLKIKSVLTRTLFILSFCCLFHTMNAFAQATEPTPTATSDASVCLKEKKADVCFQLGLDADQKNNKTEAEKFYKAGCLNKNGASCFNLGVLYSTGNASNKMRSALYYRQACDYNHAEGCYFNGIAEEDAGKKDNASILYRRACDMKIAKACFRAGQLLAQTNNLVLAVQYHKQACELQDGYACGVVAGILEELGDKIESQKYYKLACGLKIDKACEKAGIKK